MLEIIQAGIIFLMAGNYELTPKVIYKQSLSLS